MDFYAFLDEPDEELGHKALQTYKQSQSDCVATFWSRYNLYGICFCEECKKKSKKNQKKWYILCKLFNK